MSRHFDGEGYLTMYPKFNKWINQCVKCQTKGYKPEMPSGQKVRDGVFVFAYKNIRRLFNPLPLNENQICEQCSFQEQNAG